MKHQGAGEIVSVAVSSSAWIKTQPVKNLAILSSLLDKVNQGEAEAIALAIELNATELLIDERVGRREATRLGIPITGVLGVLTIAKRRGIIPAVKPLMDDLIERAVFRVSESLYSIILQNAGE